MSLLLEALKKAELAKQSAKTTSDIRSAGMKPIVTREALPDISQPLEILANDLPSAGAAVTNSLELTLDTPAIEHLRTEPAPIRSIDETSDAPQTATVDTGERTEPTMATATEDAANAEADRAAARKVFEVKEVDYNPRRPFYITIGLLGLCAIGYGTYVWWQMQPRSAYNAAAVKNAPAAERVATQAPPTAQAQALPVTPAAPDGTPQAPGQTPAPASAQAAAPVTTAAAKATATSPAAPTLVARGRQDFPIAASSANPPAARTPAQSVSNRAAPAERRGTTAPIAITPSALAVDPQTERAYNSFQQGDLSAAKDLYQRVLQRDPGSRDALLGLAAIDSRNRDYELAESRYLKLLELDPRDTHALAGIIALRGQTDPIQSESRLKTVIASQPDSAHLHFALGNQFAAQSRWPEAQASYFRAYSLEPENPDFTFNLAISLDRLQQKKLALEHYQRAISLANTRAANFDKAQVAARIAALSR